MRIALFGNYAFAKTVAEMIVNRCELVCFCNDVHDDNKFGVGIQKYAHDNNIKIIIGNKEQHINFLEEFMPDYILAVAYKNLIPVDDLPMEVYGIHLGGIYGSDAIRGKSSLVWYKLRNIKYAKVSLYRYTTNNIDVGEIIKEIKFPISLDDNININLQLDCVKSLVDFIIKGDFKFSVLKKEFITEQLGSYYPRAIKKIYGGYLNENEIIQLEKAGIINYSKKLPTEQKLIIGNSMDIVYQYCSGESSNKNVLFLHGFASIIPNDKTKKLSCLLDGISVNIPLVKGINRIYCDGMQNYGDVYSQFETLIGFYDLSKTIIVCSSISSLLLCEHLDKLLNAKAIIFVTPIFNLFDNAFDEKLKEVVWNGLKERNFEFSNPYYKGCKMSKELLEKLKNFDLLEYIRKIKSIKNKIYFIFADDDPNINAQKWRNKCIEETIPLNNINIIDGSHSFSDIIQLYYLACLIRKIFG
jgi:hypothetical protein